jgi:hypothetical protein
MRFSLGAVATFRGSRRIRRCGYKQKHWSSAAAVAHLSSLRYRFGQRTDCLVTYHCRYCGAWHVGRRKMEVAS